MCEPEEKKKIYINISVGNSKERARTHTNKQAKCFF